MKNSIIIRFGLFLLFWISLVFSVSAQFSGGGTGTEADPFKIKTAEDLEYIRNYTGANYADKHFRLMNSIDLTNFLKTSQGWPSIGNYNFPFAGYFHGSGYEVTGLWINEESLSYVGLFGANSGQIDSLGITISSKNIVGGKYAGGLVSYNFSGGLINQCYVKGGSVSSTTRTTSYSGGLVGFSIGTVTNSYATVNSTAICDSSANCYSYVGGLIGFNSGTITACYATGNSAATSTLSGPSSSINSGGFVGTNNGNITASYATGNPTATTLNVSVYPSSGGFVGYNTGTVSNCFATGKSNWSLSGRFYAGGFVGYVKSGKIFNCYSIGEAKKGESRGGFAAYCIGTDYLSSCYYNSDITDGLPGVGYITNPNVSGKTTAEMKTKNTYVDWDFNTVWRIDEKASYPYLYWQPAGGLPTGIENKMTINKALTAYPNPTSGIVSVNCDVNKVIRIYSISGLLQTQQVSTSEREAIDLSGYANGMYIIKIDDQEAKIIKR